jgi:hypothetical protein
MSMSNVDGAITHQETEDGACWHSIKESSDLCLLEQFVVRFPDSPYAASACLKAESMIRTCNDWTQLERFLRDYDSSERTPLALSRIRELDQDRLETQTGALLPSEPLGERVRNILTTGWVARRNVLGYVFASAALLAIASLVLLPAPVELDTIHATAPGPRDHNDLRLQAGTRESLESYLLQNPNAEEPRHALEKLDDEAFYSAERVGTIQAYRDYMNAWPNGGHAAAGKERIAELEAAIEDNVSFEAAKNRAAKEGMEGYLAAHASGLHVEEARHYLARLDTAAYQAAMERNNPDAYRKYLEIWPAGQHRAAAQLHISELAAEVIEDDSDFANAKAGLTKSALEEYLGSHPQGRHVAEVAEKLDELETAAYQNSVRVNTELSYQIYLSDWSNGRHAAMANTRLSELKDARIADNQAFQMAKEQNTKKSLEDYLISHAHALHAREAQEIMSALEVAERQAIEQANIQQLHKDQREALPTGFHTETSNVRLPEIKSAQTTDDQASKEVKEQSAKSAPRSHRTSDAGELRDRRAQPREGSGRQRSRNRPSPETTTVERRGGGL